VNTSKRNTRDHILSTAERLFAECGIERTSIRQINKAAGQRNSSATRYHFGTKTHLIEAIFDRRLRTIDARQLARLDALPAILDVRHLLKTLVLPLAEQLTSEAECFYFSRLVQQVNNDPKYSAISRQRIEQGEVMRRLRTRVSSRLDHLPASIVAQRLDMVSRQIYCELADQQRKLAAEPIDAGLENALFISGLLDAISASLQAPLSNETSVELARTKRRTA